MRAKRNDRRSLPQYRILVIQLKRLGDLVLTTPALSILRRAFADAEITLLIDRDSDSLVPAIEGVDRVLVYGRTKSFWRRVIGTRFNLCLDFTGNDRSALIAFLSKAPERLGFSFLQKKPLRALAYNRFVSTSLRERHTIDLYLDLVRPVAASQEAGEIALTIPEPVRQSVVRMRNDSVLPARFVVVHPGSAKVEKYWIADRWAELLSYMQERLELPCVLTGGQDPYELKHISDILSGSGDRSAIFNLAGKVDLLTTACIIEGASFFIGVDTVAAHFATAFRRPSITLYGPTNPFHWRARHPSALVLRAGQSGPIRQFDPGQRGAPMSELSTQSVIHAMEQFWKGGMEECGKESER